MQQKKKGQGETSACAILTDLALRSRSATATPKLVEDIGTHEATRLRKDVEWALRRALDPNDVLPMLHRLARTATAGSDESIFAHRQLAELIASRHPWRAALYAKRVLSFRPDDDRAWAVLALAQTLLGHYRFAVTAYRHALACSPKNNPWYAHNLGHLLDVALGHSDDALVWLKTAYTGAPQSGEIATSYAHALASAGKLVEAKKVLSKSMKRGVSREQAALWRWIEAGAKPGRSGPPPNALLATRLEADARDEAAPMLPPKVKPRSKSKARKAPAADKMGVLESVLVKGLTNLPLDAKQRARARAIARGAAASETLGTPSATAAGVAAAIAYAIVFVDHVPLTQAEVAAPFRTSVASVRGLFSDLRTRLNLSRRRQ